jgi:hypothetical protein
MCNSSLSNWIFKWISVDWIQTIFQRLFFNSFCSDWFKKLNRLVYWQLNGLRFTISFNGKMMRFKIWRDWFTGMDKRIFQRDFDFERLGLLFCFYQWIITFAFQYFVPLNFPFGLLIISSLWKITQSCRSLLFCVSLHITYVNHLVNKNGLFVEFVGNRFKIGKSFDVIWMSDK